MARCDEILSLPLQNPLTLEFSAETSLVLMCKTSLLLYETRIAKWLPVQETSQHGYVYCSCRGLVYAGVNGKQKIQMYVWNPSTGLSQKLPDPGVTDEYQIFTGFGYVSAIANSRLEEGEHAKIRIFSSQSKSWRRIQDSPYSDLSMTVAGILCHEALHWLRFNDDVIVAFDLANEKFRTMALPVVGEEYGCDYFRHVGDFRGCLCVIGLANITTMDLWVMKEYDKGNSWTKLFKVRVTDQPDEQISFVQPILVSETCIFLEIHTESGSGAKLVRSYHKEEKTKEVHMDRYSREIIGYEESLVWLD